MKVGDKMSRTIKRCKLCGAFIMDDTGDYFRFISVKYCDSCRALKAKQSHAERQRKYRARLSEKQKADKQELERLKVENVRLREQNRQLTENLERKGKQ